MGNGYHHILIALAIPIDGEREGGALSVYAIIYIAHDLLLAKYVELCIAWLEMPLLFLFLPFQILYLYPDPPTTTPNPSPTTTITTNATATTSTTSIAATMETVSDTEEATTAADETVAPIQATGGYTLAIVASVVVVGVVVVVVVVISFIVYFVCKRTSDKKTIPEAATLPDPAPNQFALRKPSDSTTTTSSGSSNPLGPDSVGTLESEVTVQPQQVNLQLGNGAPTPTEDSGQVNLPRVVHFDLTSHSQRRTDCTKGTDGAEDHCSRRTSMPSMETQRDTCSSRTASHRDCHFTKHPVAQLDDYARERLENWRLDIDSTDQPCYPNYTNNCACSHCSESLGHAATDNRLSAHRCGECRNQSTDMHPLDVQHHLETECGLTADVDWQQQQSSPNPVCVTDWQRTRYYYSKRTDSICSTGNYSIFSSPDGFNSINLSGNIPESQVAHV